jgi:hypothetical protein
VSVQSCAAVLTCADESHPELFRDDADLFRSDADQPASAASAIVLAAASQFAQTASSLASIVDTPLPPAAASMKLVDAGARLADVAALQAAHEREAATLRQRSIDLLRRWYATDILLAGEYWAEVEQRIEAATRTVRRHEKGCDV